MDDQQTKLEAECARNTAGLATLEDKMNDRFQHIDAQIAELQRSKVGVEMREDINRRFDELREELNQRFDQVNQRFNDHDRNSAHRFDDHRHNFAQRFADLRTYMGQRFDDMGQRFDDMGQRFDDMGQRFNDMGQRFDDARKESHERHRQTDHRLDRIESNIHDMQTFARWMVGSQIAVAIGVLSLAAKAFYG